MERTRFLSDEEADSIRLNLALGLPARLALRFTAFALANGHKP